MKTLLILRHAKSSWRDPALDDHERPLNGRGRRDAPRMGVLIRNLDLVPDRIICSTAVRARDTAAHVCEAFDDVDVVLDPMLYHASPRSAIQTVVRQAGDAERVMIVAHNPGLEDLVTLLTGTWERLPTAALVRVDLDIDAWSGLWDETPGQLLHVWRPKEIFEKA